MDNNDNGQGMTNDSNDGMISNIVIYIDHPPSVCGLIQVEVSECLEVMMGWTAVRRTTTRHTALLLHCTMHTCLHCLTLLSFLWVFLPAFSAVLSLSPAFHCHCLHCTAPALPASLLHHCLMPPLSALLFSTTSSLPVPHSFLFALSFSHTPHSYGTFVHLHVHTYIINGQY